MTSKSTRKLRNTTDDYAGGWRALALQTARLLNLHDRLLKMVVVDMPCPSMRQLDRLVAVNVVLLHVVVHLRTGFMEWALSFAHVLVTSSMREFVEHICSRPRGLLIRRLVRRPPLPLHILLRHEHQDVGR